MTVKPIPRFDVVTLFDDQFKSLVGLGVVGRALKRGDFELHTWNPRNFTEDLHRTVDDRPYGGGPGMVMLIEPLVKTLRAIQAHRGHSVPVVFLTPHAPLLKQQHVRNALSDWPTGCILICGRYEGVDQRFIDHYVDATFCLGDFVLSGGELAVACWIDTWVRLLPGVLNHSLSAFEESFENGLLDCPHYTRPEVFEENSVPGVLLSGNHAKIESWRKQASFLITKKFRPDLLSALALSQVQQSDKTPLNDSKAS